MKRFATLLAFILFASVMASAQNAGGTENVSKIGEAINYIDNNYLDTIDINALVDKSIAEMFYGLDPHSSFIPASNVKSANEELDGSFEGVGIEYAIIADTAGLGVPAT
jgi:Periplasmic protease